MFSAQTHQNLFGRERAVIYLATMFPFASVLTCGYYRIKCKCCALAITVVFRRVGRLKMFLEEVLGSKTKVRILYTLFKKEKDSYFEKELAEMCGSSVSEVNRQISSLVEFGLVHFYKEGRLKMYKLNPAHFLYKPLKELFTATG